MALGRPPTCRDGAISVLDMHTGGEPLRIVTGGFPPVLGHDILSKRRYVRDQLDGLRRFLLFEPRGHRDMYGALLVGSEEPDAHLGVLFMHNQGYSTMCGHAVLALGRYALDYGLIAEPSSPETQVNIHCPCGLVRAYVQYDQGKSGRVRFHSVPAFVFATGRGRMVAVKLHHPDSEDLAFLYGTIITDGKDALSEEPTANICVFADAQVDRSPCGSGVTARVALQYHKGFVLLNQTRTFQSGPTGSLFTGKAVEETKCGDFKAVTVEIAGQAHYTGTANFYVEDDDVLKDGFLLR
ncbi:trans-L-3-hydroxyproline dehydratase isoform X2 [Hemitrygon akajei]|uniref:trans-L-3-hydroxyproline dehydratase isoform X2 n=1 Tax=Hemitrygon akajei TaxID=2704970 RepID=UPI003BF97A62